MNKPKWYLTNERVVALIEALEFAVGYAESNSDIPHDVDNLPPWYGKARAALEAIRKEL